jgi:DNA-3-methyladenine glycosylase II
MSPAATSSIPVLGPFSWEQALEGFAAFQPMARQARPGDDVLRFAFRLDGSHEAAAVALRPDGDRIAVEVAGTADAGAAVAQAARILSLDHDATSYPEVGVRDPEVGRLMEALPGLRPLCFLSPYECAAWAVMSQRISMRQAAAIQKRLVDAHGETVTVDGAPTQCFPHPAVLAGLDRIQGLPPVKVERLHGVAAAALEGTLDATRLRELGPLEGPRLLQTIPGIGAFWSSGIYLRALGVPDVFPDEPVSIAALGHLHGLGDELSAADVERLAEPFRPWRMWVCYLLRVAAGRADLIPGIKGQEMELRRRHRPASR